MLSRDEADLQDDGTPASDPTSHGYLWAVRDAIVIRVQVTADELGRTATTATDAARQFVGPIETQG